MKKLLYAVLFIFNCCSSNKTVVSDEEKTVDKITYQTAKKLREKKNLILVGTGGQMMHEVVKLHMGLAYYHEVDIENGRNLIVTAVEEYLSEINSCKELIPYLSHYPFDPRNIHISIFIQNPDGSNVTEGKISVINAIHGKVKYKADSKADNGAHSYTYLFQETYEEALNKSLIAKDIEGRR